MDEAQQEFLTGPLVLLLGEEMEAQTGGDHQKHRDNLKFFEVFDSTPMHVTVSDDDQCHEQGDYLQLIIIQINIDISSDSILLVSSSINISK